MADPRDPRVQSPPGPTLPGQSLEGFAPRILTDEEQEAQIRQLMTDLFRATLPESDPLSLPITDVIRDRHAETLLAWAFHTPNLFNTITSELQNRFGIDPLNPEIPIDAALAEVFNQILSTAEQRSEVMRTDKESTTLVTTEGTTIRDRDVTINRTRFVELPTPEEFMDDFQTGLAVFVAGLRKSGGITRDAAAFVLANPQQFFNDYLVFQSARIDAGEDIFQVVGATGEPIFIGEREAGSEEIETTGIDRERVLREVIANEREQIEEEVIRDLTSTGTVETTEQQQQIDTEIDRRIAERATTLINEAIQFFGTENTITTEQIFSRPQATRVFKIAPLSFLSSQFPASAIENLAAVGPATQQARRETSQGTNVSAPRRVGGR